MSETSNAAAWSARTLLASGLAASLLVIPWSSSGASSSPLTWASLGQVIPAAEQSSEWGSALDANTSSSAYAWCGADGIHVTQSNGAVKTVPETGVEAMLAARALTINHNTKVVCDLVVTDPLNSDTVFAGFEAGQNYSIPPVATVAMYTRNDGASWHFIPPPTKMTYLDFGGYALRSSVVQAVFTNEVEMANTSSRWSINAQVEGSGGSWDSGSLACPTVGPCVTFGPELPQGACGMSSWKQALLVAVPGTPPGNPVWEGTTWASGIPECGPALLFSDQHNYEYLLDFSMRDPLVRSVDGGFSWQPVQLPLRVGHKVGGSPIAGNDVTTITPSGDLLVVIGPPGATTERLLMLAPGATQWCSVSGVLPSDTRTDPVNTMGATASRLVVLQDSTTGAIAQSGPERSVPLTSLRCAN
jgi:hypothetical protein